MKEKYIRKNLFCLRFLSFHLLPHSEHYLLSCFSQFQKHCHCFALHRVATPSTLILRDERQPTMKARELENESIKRMAKMPSRMKYT